jgi:hypothetical protein
MNQRRKLYNAYMQVIFFGERATVKIYKKKGE